MARATVAQALVSWLANQHVERDGQRQRFFEGVFGIFGHGNVAGMGEALEAAQDDVRYYQARNEQAMVHTAAAFAKQSRRLRTFACTTSIGPGATNLVTGAATATVNRLPVLLLPGRPLRDASRQARPPAARASRGGRRVGERHAAAGVALLRPHRARRDAHRRAARRDARADLARRDRRGDARAAAGRPGRGLRTGRTSLLEPRTWVDPAGAPRRARSWPVRRTPSPPRSGR